MKKLFSIIAIALCFTINAQTKISIGAGVLEQSNKLGLGVATTIGVSQNVIGDWGITTTYNYSFLKEDNFQQLYLAAFYEAKIDNKFSIIPSVGAARQISGYAYPAIALDLLARASDNIQLKLGWQPTMRGAYHDPATGWSLITTFSLVIEL